MRIRILPFVIAISTATTAYALPVLESRIGSAVLEPMAILSDDQNQNKFHLMPQKYSLARDNDSRASFVAVEMEDSQGPEAYVTMTFSPQFDRYSCNKALVEIRNTKPCADFDFIPMRNTTLDTSSNMLLKVNPEKNSLDCTVDGLLVGQEFSCNMVLDAKALKVLKSMVASRKSEISIGAVKFRIEMKTSKGQETVSASLPLMISGIDESYFISADGTPGTSVRPANIVSNDLAADVLAEKLTSEWRAQRCEAKHEIEDPNEEKQDPPSVTLGPGTRVVPWQPGTIGPVTTITESCVTRPWKCVAKDPKFPFNLQHERMRNLNNVKRMFRQR